MNPAQFLPAAAALAGSLVLLQALRPSEAQRARRQRQRLRAARIEAVLQAQLIAHRLPDTPANRARMLQELGRGRS